MRNIYILSILIIKIISIISISNSLDSDKMYIFLDEKIYLINLKENDITNELICILPLKTKLVEEEDEKHKYLIPLLDEIETSNFIFEQEENKNIKAVKGDLLLFKKKELILFNEDKSFFDENNDYIKIGRLDDVDDFLNSVKKNNKIFLWNELNYQNQKGKVKPNVYYTSIMNYLTWKIFTFFCFIFL